MLLVEFSNSNYAFMTDALRASYAFANSLKKDDYVAIIEYDMKPNILLDFTQDKNAVYGALNMLRIPGFSESNLFDAASGYAGPVGSHRWTKGAGDRGQQAGYLQPHHLRQGDEAREGQRERHDLYRQHG